MASRPSAGAPVSETSRWYDRIAPRYDSEMEGGRDRLLREAFWELVGRYGDPDRPLLDFGCGTGIDAARYAEMGYRVIAYDVSEGMIRRLLERCGTAYGSGGVVPVLGEDALWSALARFPDVATLTANFSVINHLEDLDRLTRLVREGLPALQAIVISVLNPFFVRDMGRAWWWRGLLRSPLRGSIDCPEGEVSTRRYLVSTIVDALGPPFVVREQRSVIRARVHSRFPMNRLGQLRILALERTE